MIQTMENLTPDIASGVQTHILVLPPMCPVSGNPRTGSYVAIRYTPVDTYLEVYSLEHYINRFIGGWLSRGIRDMEQVIATIAGDCAGAVGVSVTVRARLVLDAGRMSVTKHALPPRSEALVTCGG